MTPTSSGRLSAAMIVLFLTSLACNKMSPALRQSTAEGAVSADGAKNTAQSRSAHCAPGQPLATSGEFYWPIDPTLPNYAEAVVVLGGANNGEYDLIELRDHIKRGLAGACYPRSQVMTTYILDLKYFITASIYDLHGNLLFQAQDNKWQVFKNAAGRYNYDDNGFELYDKSGQIALSIDFKVYRVAPALFINGITPCDDSILYYYSPHEIFSNIPYGTRQLDREFGHLYNSAPIAPLFRYTGKDWQHARL